METEQAKLTIAREKEIGRVSGNEDMEVLHANGETIVFCGNMVSKDYAEYKRLGGTKTLQNIR